jgi:hypothetical protein
MFNFRDETGTGRRFIMTRGSHKIYADVMTEANVVVLLNDAFERGVRANQSTMLDALGVHVDEDDNVVRDF